MVSVHPKHISQAGSHTLVCTSPWESSSCSANRVPGPGSRNLTVEHFRIAVGFNNWHNTNMAHVAKIWQIISPGSKLYPLGPHDYGPCHVRNFWGPNSSWAPLTVGPEVMSSDSYNGDGAELPHTQQPNSTVNVNHRKTFTPTSNIASWSVSFAPWQLSTNGNRTLNELNVNPAPFWAENNMEKNKLTPLVQQCATCIFDNVPASLAFSIYHRVGQYPN